MATLKTNNLQGQSNNHSKTDPQLALIQDTWLDSELEVINLRARKRKGESVGEALAAAKKRRDVLWKQLLGEWKKGWKREREAKSKPTREPAVPLEQDHEGEPEAQPGAHPGAPVQSAENVEMAGPGDELHVNKLAELGKGVSVEPNETYNAPSEAELEVPVEQSGEHEMHQPINVDLDEFEWSDSELRGLEEVDEFLELGEQSVRGEMNVYEQDESEDSDFDLDELEEVPEELEEPGEPLRKRSRLEASQPEVRPRSGRFTIQQKDIMRAWLCENFRPRKLFAKELEPVALAAGLTTTQVGDWIYKFYRRHPTPTLEQAMAWRKSSSSHTDILNEWLAAHRDDPYPSLEEKQRLARETGKTLKQIDSWFDRARQMHGLARHNYSPAHIAMLGASFEENIYPNEEEKQRLASETGKTIGQIDAWFNYTRQRSGLRHHNFSAGQITTLGASFEENTHPSAGEKGRLATETGLSFKQVDGWFKNQRIKTGMAGQRKLRAAPLLEWVHANMENPYPSVDKMKELAEVTGRTKTQVHDWFKCKRRKLKVNKDKKSTRGVALAAGRLMLRNQN